MRETMNHPPRTIMQVFKMLPEGTLAEVIDKNLYMSPAPSAKHQDVLLEIASAIREVVKKENKGKVLISPIDVYLDEDANAVQPDILFLSDKKKDAIAEDGCIHGIPDLIIEILSSGNKKHDTITKKDMYEKFGVQEYWVVDPETRQTIGYQLKSTRYILIGEFNAEIPSLLLQAKFTF